MVDLRIEAGGATQQWGRSRVTEGGGGLRVVGLVATSQGLTTFDDGGARVPVVPTSFELRSIEGRRSSFFFHLKWKECGGLRSGKAIQKGNAV